MPRHMSAKSSLNVVVCAAVFWAEAVAGVALAQGAVSTMPVHRTEAGLPDKVLTPGEVTSTDARMVCWRGYATHVRPRGKAWKRLRELAYARYGIKHGMRSIIDASGHRHAAYQIDHLIPLELGGAPADIRNLWPQPIATAHRKDRVEDALHAMVCEGSVSLASAQRAIAQDWETAVTRLRSREK